MAERGADVTGIDAGEAPLEVARLHLLESGLDVHYERIMVEELASQQPGSFDAVLLNTAVAKAGDPVQMAAAFGAAVKAGRTAFLAGLMEPRDMAVPSTPVAGTPFFDLEAKR